MHSMTGFGRGSAQTSVGQLIVEIKTVNHRFLEIRTKLPIELNGMELTLEKQIRERLSRGFCNLHVSMEKTSSEQLAINTNKLSTYIEIFKNIASQNKIPVDALLPALSGAPDLFEPPLTPNNPANQISCTQACSEALDALLHMRNKEGQAMEENLRQRLTSIAQFVSQINEQSSEFERTVLDKYRSKITDIVKTNSPIDEQRIETEAAIIAEKADINEEITRLQSHLGQMKMQFDTIGPIGRRMDFLIQEIGREANTIASKSVSASVTHLVVDIKSELEKIRELVQNVE